VTDSKDKQKIVSLMQEAIKEGDEWLEMKEHNEEAQAHFCRAIAIGILHLVKKN